LDQHHRLTTLTVKLSRIHTTVLLMIILTVDESQF